MAYKSILRSDAIARYVNVDMLHETDVKRRLREETAALPNGQMQISADQGAFLELLVKLLDAHRALEIGTFTGYSALCIASALPADGMLIACDISDEWTSIGRRYWREAGVADKIDLRLAPANNTLAALLSGGSAGTFDLAFIDADKEAYEGYYETSLKLLRNGGLIVMDNVMMAPRGSEPATFDPVQSPMHALNLKVRNDTRVQSMIATVGGGFMLARKR